MILKFLEIDGFNNFGITLREQKISRLIEVWLLANKILIDIKIKQMIYGCPFRSIRN